MCAANEAIQAAVERSRAAVAKSRILNELKTEDNFKANRAAIEAAARESAAESVIVAELYEQAKTKAQVAANNADTEIGKRYWQLKRDAFSKLRAAAETAAEGYAAWSDSTNPDLKTSWRRQNVYADRAVAARAEADRLNTEAEQLAKENRGKF